MLTACSVQDEPVMPTSKPYIVFENVVFSKGRLQLSYEYYMRFHVYDSEPFEIYIDDKLRLRTHYADYEVRVNATSIPIGTHTFTYKSGEISKTIEFDMVEYPTDMPGTYTMRLYGNPR